MSAAPLLRTEFDSHRLEDTERFARLLACYLAPGDVVALHGDLGSGKSALAREVLLTFMPELEEVPSPTFTLVNVYDEGVFPLRHCDAYRMESEDEARAIGLEEMFEDGILLIEWPEILAGMLPGDALHVFLTATGEATRRIAVKGLASRWRILFEALPTPEVP